MEIGIFKLQIRKKPTHYKLLVSGDIWWLLLKITVKINCNYYFQKLCFGKYSFLIRFQNFLRLHFSSNKNKNWNFWKIIFMLFGSNSFFLKFRFKYKEKKNYTHCIMNMKSKNRTIYFFIVILLFLVFLPSQYSTKILHIFCNYDIKQREKWKVVLYTNTEDSWHFMEKILQLISMHKYRMP